MIQHIQVLAEQAGKTWQELNDEPGKVFFPNFGDGDNILKSGVDIDRVMFTIPGTNFKIYWYGFLIALGIEVIMVVQRVRSARALAVSVIKRSGSPTKEGRRLRTADFSAR